MTDITIIALPRDDVIAYLGPDWPPAPDAVLVRIDPAAGVTDGAVVVYETPGQPGTTWWLVDGVIPPQGAGLGGESLASLIPGAIAEVPPEPDQQTPPVDHPPRPLTLSIQTPAPPGPNPGTWKD